MPKSEVSQIDDAYRLIVEGIEDWHFFAKFQEEMQTYGELKKRANIQELGGKDQHKKLRRVLGALANLSGIRTIGIIRDADDDPQTAFSSVVGTVAAVGLPVPDSIGEFVSGESEYPKIGVLIVPHDSSGIRETLCLRSIADAPILSCVDSFIDCVVGNGKTLHSIDKSRLMAYLAAQEHTDTKISTAIMKEYINWKSPVFGRIHQFLKELTEFTM